MTDPKETLEEGVLQIQEESYNRMTKVQIQDAMSRILELMGDNKTTPEICEIMCKDLNKSEAQVKRYIKKATEELQKGFDREANVRRMEMEQSLRNDLNDAYAIFKGLAPDDKLKATWYKLILETKDKLNKFTPDLVSVDDNNGVSVTYNIMPPLGDKDE